MSFRTSRSRAVWLAVFTVASLACAASRAPLALGAEIAFDLPESIECRDVTPSEFSARSYLKVIEGKLRISARVIQGTEAEIVDFLYLIASPEKRLRFQDYLPNTTLESAVAEDQIEIKDATEKSTTAGADVHVVYKLLSLGGSLAQTSKNSEASCYRQIAPKELVVASGTTDREHGVFFRLRPSRAASLEGAKEFTFLATVPKSWRGDVCTIACTARGRKDSLFSTAVAPAGARKAEVGLYLAGDAEAASLAEGLRRAQDTYAKSLADQPPKPSALQTLSSQTVGWFGNKKPHADPQAELEETAEALAEVRERLSHLAR